MTWTPAQLATIADAEEIQISSHRPDGTLRPFVIIWAVASGDGVFVRSAYGRGNGWYRRALTSGTGRIRTGGLESDVTFVQPDLDDQPGVDAAYLAKYARFTSIVKGIVGPELYDVTLQLVPVSG